MNKEFVDTIGKFKLEYILAVVGGILLIAGIVGFFNLPKKSAEIEILPATESAQTNNEQIIIDIAGAVNAPGVYNLTVGSRVGEALEKAGGIATDADKNWIAKNLNLAAKLSDGAKIYIPFANEATSQKIAGGSSNQPTLAKVNINAASQSELEALAGIGPVTAGKIIANRPYQSIEELLSKKIVGKSTYQKIKDQVTTF